MFIVNNEDERQWQDDDGTLWDLVTEAEADQMEPGWIYSFRPYPELGYGSAEDGERTRVKRAQTPEERVVSDRRADSYERAMRYVEAQWSSLIDALNELLPQGSVASLWQTGGMCLAIGWMVPSIGPEAEVMVTSSDGPLSAERSDESTPFMVGAYLTEDESMSGESLDGTGAEVYAQVEGTSAGELERDTEAAEKILAVVDKLFGARKVAS